MNEIKDPYTLLEMVVDTQTNLVVIIEDEKPILINKAFKDFFGVNSFEQYTQGFGAFINNFVPHPSYFHAGKIAEGETWIQSLMALADKDKIVSMLNTSHEPRAFNVTLNDAHEQYTVMSLEDISANLIKCIMIENDMNMDEKSGAYTKDYFLHTAEILQDGAAYNEKEVGLSLIHLDVTDEVVFRDSVKRIKGVIRENDILVKWSGDMLLLAYLTDKKDNAILFTKKVHGLLRSVNASTVISLVHADEKIPSLIHKMRTELDALNKNEMKVL